MIEEYGFGMISVQGYSYARDLIVLPEHVIENWEREMPLSFQYLSVWNADSIM